MNTTLKEIIKPPFYRDLSSSCGVIRSGDGSYITQVALGDEAADFIAAALNEKWKRDFGEHERWIEHKDDEDRTTLTVWQCPKCNEDYAVGRAERRRFNHCPKCGVKLSPPETLHWHWSESGNEYVCPVCNYVDKGLTDNHCDSCGVRLLPPEWGK